MRLGYAVKTLGDGGLPSHDARKRQSGPHLRWSLELAFSTWPEGVRPKIHYSTPKTAMEERRKAKAKDLALLRLREQMAARGVELAPGARAPVNALPAG